MITTPIRAVLYDLDGTLLDTIGDISHAANHVLRLHGMPEYESDEYRKLVGWGLSELMSKCIPPAVSQRGEQYREQLVAACTAEVKAEYAAHPVDFTVPYDGIPEVLRELKSRGYLQAVLSNKADELVHVIVRRMLPADLFSVVQGQKPSVPTKPDPQAARAICTTLGLPAQEVLYVGDTAVDVETARNAGMICVGVSWGFRGREEVRDAGAQYVIDRPEELLELLPRVNEAVQEGKLDG